MRPKKFCSAAKSVFAMFIAFSLVSAIVSTQARAQKFRVLHTFHGKDGASPVGVLVRDAAGNLYGTTGAGGTGKCSQYGCGTVFKLNKAGKQVWLHSFEGRNGYISYAGLLRDAAGTLFGTTMNGGTINNICGGVQAGGCGLVFELDKAGTKERVLYKFKGDPDGLNPEALLVEDAHGNLYGTTYVGGGSGLGTVFKVDTAGRRRCCTTLPEVPTGASRIPGLPLTPLATSMVLLQLGALASAIAGTAWSSRWTRLAMRLYCILLEGRTGTIPTLCCSLIRRGISTERPRMAAAVWDVETQAVARFLSCPHNREESGQKRCFTACVPSRTARTGKHLVQARWFGTRQGICTVPQPSAALIGTAMERPAGSFSSWTRPARKPYCIALRVGRTGRIHSPVLSWIAMAISMEPLKQAVRFCIQSFTCGVVFKIAP
jgi:uncharacterized repeat protein (TIGR03803 family)